MRLGLAGVGRMCGGRTGEGVEAGECAKGELERRWKRRGRHTFFAVGNIDDHRTLAQILSGQYYDNTLCISNILARLQKHPV